MTKISITRIRFTKNKQYWLDQFQQFADNFSNYSLVEFIGASTTRREDDNSCKISLHGENGKQSIISNTEQEMLGYIVDFNKNNKKYELTNYTTKYKDITLYRIKALKDFSDVKKDELGGYIEEEKNLSHQGDAWVYDDARVCENSQVIDNAKVYEEALVRNYSTVKENASVGGTVYVSGSIIRRNESFHSNTWIFG